MGMKQRMRHLEAITGHEVVAHFLETEIRSVRFERKILDLLQRDGWDRRIIDAPNLRDPEENAYRTRLLGDFRGYRRREGIFKFVPEQVAWHRYALSREELAKV